METQERHGRKGMQENEKGFLMKIPRFAALNSRTLILQSQYITVDSWFPQKRENMVEKGIPFGKILMTEEEIIWYNKT